MTGQILLLLHHIAYPLPEHVWLIQSCCKLKKILNSSFNAANFAYGQIHRLHEHDSHPCLPVDLSTLLLGFYWMSRHCGQLNFCKQTAVCLFLDSNICIIRVRKAQQHLIWKSVIRRSQRSPFVQDKLQNLMYTDSQKYSNPLELNLIS